ncbi:MAG: monovalent cation/H(+) antiporter subunit G [Gammaproteobacteria bacterium]|nr:monovalent cation/H(+) antiporter subunit G [Gammaproteobacteria bacterium]
MSALEVFAALLLLLGGFFFLSGTVGLLRFPDTLSRLHAVTKADNLGLGLILLGVAVHGANLVLAAKLLLIWMLALLAASFSAHLVARSHLRDEASRDG